VRTLTLLVLASVSFAQGKPRLVAQVGHGARLEEFTPVRSIAHSPDDRLVLSGGGESAVGLWRQPSGKCMAEIRLEKRPGYWAARQLWGWGD